MLEEQILWSVKNKKMLLSSELIFQYLSLYSSYAKHVDWTNLRQFSCMTMNNTQTSWKISETVTFCLAVRESEKSDHYDGNSAWDNRHAKVSVTETLKVHLNQS